MQIEAYCDESRQEYFAHPDSLGDDKFMLLGSLWLETAARAHIKSKLRSLRERHQLRGEFKWTRVSPSKLPFYQELIELFFSEPLRFRALVLPANELDAVRLHDGDNELMFYKFYYLMLQAWILDFNTYRLFLDAKTHRVRQRLPRLQQVLQNANHFSEINTVQALASHQVDLLQLVDVLIGAVGYRFHGTGESSAKWTIVDSIERHLGHRIGPTVRCEDKFNIFRWRPGGGW